MTEPLYCANHPKVETTLRCNRCEKPICTKCAVHMSTGYRCKECVKAQQKSFENARWRDYLFGFLVALILSGIGAAIVTVIGGWWYGLGTLLFAPFAAKIIVRSAQAVTNRHYSRKLFLVIAIGVLLGGLPVVLGDIFDLFLIFSNPEYYNGQNWIFLVLPFVWEAVYLMIAVPGVYFGLSNISLD
jgi:hypothetical protein